MNKNLLIKFNAITNVLIILMLGISGFVWADTNGIWVRAEDVVPGTFGDDEEEGNFTFDSKLVANEEFCLGGECHSELDSICQSWLESNSIN